MKKILSAAILAATMMTGANASSVSGTTNFKVKVPEILVLYHWDEAQLDLKGKNFNYKDTKSHKLTQAFDLATATIVENPVNTDTKPAGLDGTKVTVTLKDSWAVRSIASNNVTMAVAVQKSDHLLNGTDTSSKAVVSDAAVSTTSIAPSWNATKGDIKFQLDLSGVTKPGEHKTAATRSDATDTFKLTLTGS